MVPLNLRFSGFPRALERILEGRLPRRGRGNLRDAYIYLWLARYNGDANVSGSVTTGQEELAAQMGISEPTLSASISRLVESGLLSQSRINALKIREFCLVSQGNLEQSLPQDGRWIVAEQVCFESVGADLTKEARVLLALMACLSDRVGLVKGLKEKGLAAMLGVKPEKVLRLLRQLAEAGALNFDREKSRGCLPTSDSELLVKLNYAFLLGLGWNSQSVIVRTRNYRNSDSEGVPEGVSKYVRSLSYLRKGQKSDELNRELLFSRRYLVDEPLLWPELPELYFLQRTRDWIERYTRKFDLHPLDIVGDLTEFQCHLIDEAFLSNAAKLIDVFQSGLAKPRDDVLYLACDLISKEMISRIVRRGFQDRHAAWLVEELAVCLIRQAQRGRWILEAALGWPGAETKHGLECRRASLIGKLNSYEVMWSVTHNHSEAKQITFDLEQCPGSVVVRDIDDELV